MATTPINDYDSRMKEELSPTAYAAKQFRIMGITIAGAGVGYGLGKVAKGMGVMGAIERALGKQVSAEEAAEITKKVGNLPEWTGAFLGMMGSGMFLGYEHWFKEEAAKMAVDEINRDISQARIRTNPDLLAENRALRAILLDQDKQLAAAKGTVPTTRVAATDAVAQSTVVEPAQRTVSS